MVAAISSPTKPSQLRRLARNWYGLHGMGRPMRPLFVWGAPGVGKSAVVRAAADDLGIEYMDVRLVYHGPEDFKFPIVDAERKAIDWVCSLFPADPNWKGIIALEELPQCQPLVQSAAMQLTLDRMVGSYRLPDGALLIACGNRIDDRAGAGRIHSALTSRFVHYDFVVDVQEWIAHAIEKDFNDNIVALMQWQPHLLHEFDPTKNERSFKNPRGWEYASDAMAVVDEDLRFLSVAGCVGDHGAAQLQAFMEVREGLEKRYPISKIISDPSGTPVPSLAEGSVLWAMSAALAEQARSKKKEVVQACTTYAMRLPVVFATHTCRSLLKTGGLIQVQTTPGFREFAAKHKELLSLAA